MNTNFKVQKGGLDDFNGKVNTEKALDANSLYAVDFSKMNSVNDMVLVLSSMGIGFPGNHPNIGLLKPFLNSETPFPMQSQFPQVEQKEMKLPKLKKLD